MEETRKKIMLVDDNMTNLAAGKNILKDKYQVYALPSAEKFFEVLEKVIPDLILLDVEMPEMNGHEVIKKLKADEGTADIPVIFLTALTESENELEGLSLGAVDYIAKPFNPSLLLKRIEIHLLVQAQRITLEQQAQELLYFNDTLRKAFSTYLSGDVVEEIIADPRWLQLGGTQRNMTAMFTDLAQFSSIAEQLSPARLVSVLNQYLSAMSDVILEEKGTIDKYVGDAIVAFFGAPVETNDHALRACVSAIAMKKYETELNRMFMEQRIISQPLLTRIGINTGDMVVGNMGTERKMNYTIIGNAVNLAARLEGANKIYGTWILASEETIRETNGAVLARRLDRIRVVGIQEPVWVFEPVALKDEAHDDLKETLDWFHTGLEFFEKREWAAAETIFSRILKYRPNDSPALLYASRCRGFLEKPPADDWDGVFLMNEK